MKTRVAAAKALAAVMSDGRTIDAVLPACLDRVPEPRDRAFAQELCYGVLRNFFALDFAAERLLQRPLRPGDADIRALLLSGIYQLGWLNIPDHAAVSETVEAAKSLRKSWATGLLNAVLRRYRRERDSIETARLASAPATYSHPDWLIDTLRVDWPSHWQSILHANNERPPLHLRVNLRAVSRNRYLELLARAGLSARASALVETGVVMEEPLDVEHLPGFAEGLVSVQDVAAQLAAPLLDLRAEQRVLDACAAPGGKAAHILEHGPETLELTCVDRNERRLRLLHDNLDRLKLRACVLRGDASRPDEWWDRWPFDRVLLDAPCSATGVIRRHPDIKLLKAPEQLLKLKELQGRLLDALWPLLKQGGRLLYCTCSLLHSENHEQIEKFSAKHKDVRILPVDARWGMASDQGRQILPGPDGTDGFYYALLEKA